MSVESVKAFYTKLAKDEAFRGQFENAVSMDERRKIVQDAGYDFTQEQFEAATAQILESELADSELSELSEEEMVAVVGGALSKLSICPPLQAIYGVVRLDEWNCNLMVQPIYGVVINDQITS